MTDRKTERGFSIPEVEIPSNQTREPGPTRAQSMQQSEADGARQANKGQKGTAAPKRQQGTKKPSGNNPVGPNGLNGTELSPDGRPILELEVHHQHGPAPDTTRGPVLCIWTVNNIYELDAAMRCVRVVRRGTGEANKEHAMMGARLVGGQRRSGGEFELTHPFPRPGTEAVFEDPISGTRFARTSTVSRVVLHFYSVTVTPNRLVPTWSDITQA